MGSIRELVLRQFLSPSPRTRGPEDELADALYFMLRTNDVEATVDGWALFRVLHETDDILEAVGLMTLLPSGSIPLAVRVDAHDDGFSWSARIGRADDAWLALSDSKRWNSVYLYATGEREVPQWTWYQKYQGIVRQTDA